MRDVLEDDPPVEVPNSGCGSCDRGWRTVQPAYAHAEALKAGEEGTGAYRQRYASALTTIYPCRICKPLMFFRWAGHHFEPDHDRSACVDCSTPRKTKTRSSGGSWTPPPPSDGDERRDLA